VRCGLHSAFRLDNVGGRAPRRAEQEPYGHHSPLALGRVVAGQLREHSSRAVARQQRPVAMADRWVSSIERGFIFQARGLDGTPTRPQPLLLKQQGGSTPRNRRSEKGGPRKRHSRQENFMGGVCARASGCS
jgi:hypothetical protein